jgi:hypothetical protein
VSDAKSIAESFVAVKERPGIGLCDFGSTLHQITSPIGFHVTSFLLVPTLALLYHVDMAKRSYRADHRTSPAENRKTAVTLGLVLVVLLLLYFLQHVWR